MRRKTHNKQEKRQGKARGDRREAEQASGGAEGGGAAGQRGANSRPGEGSGRRGAGPPEEEAAALPASASPRGLPGPKLTPDFRPDLDQRRRLSPLSCARWAMDSQGPDPNKAGPASGRTAGHPEGPLGQSLGTVTGPERSVRTGRSPPGRTSMLLPGEATAAAAKSLQSCLTLCNPIDGLLPGENDRVQHQGQLILPCGCLMSVASDNVQVCYQCPVKSQRPLSVPFLWDDDGSEHGGNIARLMTIYGISKLTLRLNRCGAQA